MKQCLIFLWNILTKKEKASILFLILSSIWSDFRQALTLEEYFKTGLGERRKPVIAGVC